MMGRISFGEAVYLILRGELPGAAVGGVMEAMLVASIDHGVTPPSALAVRNAATTGAPLNACLAAGALAVNRHHGGAVEDCMRLLARGAATVAAGAAPAGAAKALIAEEKAAGRRLPGWGHRVHTDDPRSGRLLALVKEAGVAGPHITVAEAIAAELAKGGKVLPLNVDGAIAAVLADLGFRPELANGFFILARTAGWMAHVAEEVAREKPMRRIDQAAAEYDGPAPRATGIEDGIRGPAGSGVRPPPTQTNQGEETNGQLQNRLAAGRRHRQRLHGGDPPRPRRAPLRRVLRPRRHRLGVLVPGGRPAARAHDCSRFSNSSRMDRPIALHTSWSRAQRGSALMAMIHSRRAVAVCKARKKGVEGSRVQGFE